METLRTEVVVIGSGPGGYVAAIRAGQLGKKVVCVEKEQVGGVCLNVGCIPSKALITAAKNYEKARHNETMGIFASDVKVDVARLQAWKSEVVNKLTGGVKQLVKGAGGQLLLGTATFTAPRKLEVKKEDGSTIAVEADHVIIATGSRPIAIPGFTVDQKRVLDSTGALALGEIPARLAVIGGGYIGLELGSMLAKFGSKVTVIEGTPQLLPGTDPDLVGVVQRKLKKAGVEIFLEAKALGWEDQGGAARVSIETKEGKKTIEVDKILVTVGRKPNSDGLGLEKIGVRVEKGFVVVDKQQRTSVAGVYAIGDVCGQPMLAHKASREAEVAAEVIAGHKSEMDVVAIPAVIFTDPEIAYVGLQQHDAEKAGRKLKVGKFSFAALGRSLAMAETDGFVKIIADAASDEVLGFGIVGPEASDLVSEGALALEMGAFLPDLALTVHPHPTLGEAIMEAAKAALGESPHLVGGGQRRA
ncbi:MAG TPA: dihydrolipoyl dehydrogenase [Polyangia bacterium]|nr:dihydrolipoyl dehydrogenase [Polyangia bacterium]